MTHPNYWKNKIFSLKIAKRIVTLLVFVLIFDFFFFPIPGLAAQISADAENSQKLAITAENEEEGIITNNLPESNNLKVIRTGYYTASAYNSLAAQTDSSPCITANGFNLCEHGIEDSIAANFLKFGTKVKIPEMFGDQVFVVRDRMNKKYNNRIDVWMKEKQDAKNFGVRVVKIEVLE